MKVFKDNKLWITYTDFHSIEFNRENYLVLIYRDDRRLTRLASLEQRLIVIDDFNTG